MKGNPTNRILLLQRFGCGFVARLGRKLGQLLWWDEILEGSKTRSI